MVVGDAGYGDDATFRCELATRGLPYVMAVKPATTAHGGDAEPVVASYSGRRRRPAPLPGHARHAAGFSCSPPEVDGAL
ncbi:SRSO17 transposase [Saccharopolyspora phatthalungensis]|uniref:SRSO17 transposase n=1 Tax=Saccharopolyspora phatthalungensis TaxID=664693 RepID=A0A840QAI9_9PSEU|nr:transposase [Saccharopolyspora phatthalungensis]MBB5156840.1 SRSO17 transposase [Saccharopolyspora phatthalungensis]